MGIVCLKVMGIFKKKRDMIQIKISIFFSRELALILGIGGKPKKLLEIFAIGPYITNLNEISRLV